MNDKYNNSDDKNQEVGNRRNSIHKEQDDLTVVMVYNR